MKNTTAAAALIKFFSSQMIHARICLQEGKKIFLAGMLNKNRFLWKNTPEVQAYTLLVPCYNISLHKVGGF